MDKILQMFRGKQISRIHHRMVNGREVVAIMFDDYATLAVSEKDGKLTVFVDGQQVAVEA